MDLSVAEQIRRAIAFVDKRFPKVVNDHERENLACEARSKIPKGFSHPSFLEVNGKTDCFRAVFVLKSFVASNIKTFVEAYSLLNNETLRVSTTRFCPKSEKLLEKSFRCQHNTRYEPTKDPEKSLKANPSRRLKNTGCRFLLTFKFLEDKTCELILEWDHNHPISCLQALTYKDIAESTKNKVISYFQHNFSPSLAYRQFIQDMKSECTVEEYPTHLADRSKCPRRGDFTNLYTEFCKLKYGAKNGEEMFEKMKERLQILSENGVTVKHQEFDNEADKPLIVAIVTPLMKRVHAEITQAGELTFLDSSSNMEEHNLRVFVFCTHSVAGALPLGLLITSDERVTTLVSGLRLLRDCFPPDTAFSKRGSHLGPAVIMTDNCDELREALNIIWPQAILIVCIFHLLQQVWRWLHDAKNGIAMDERPHLLNKFKTVVYASTEIEMNGCYDSFVSENVILNNTKAQEYFENVFGYKEAWSKCFRKLLTIRGNHTNNYCESNFLVLKDTILQRVKEYNINGLIDRLVFDFSDHFKNKLLSIASGSFDRVYSLRFTGKQKKKKSGIGYNVDKEKEVELFDLVAKYGNSTYLVPSFTLTNVYYLVDMVSGLCECSVGNDGSPCKHQALLWSNGCASVTNFLPVFHPELRQKYGFIAHGKILPIEFYMGLHDRVANTDCNLVDTNYDSAESNDFIVNSGGLEMRAENFENRPSSSQASSSSVSNTTSPLEIHALLEKAFQKLQSKVDLNDRSYNEGVLKFCKKIEHLPSSRLTTALHCFGNDFVTHNRITKTSSILKKGKHGKIHVQPGAITRRKSNKNGTKTGSRNAQTKGKKKSLQDLPVKTVKGKRVHQLSVNVRENVKAPKKAGRTMMSKTRTFANVEEPPSKSTKI